MSDNSKVDAELREWARGLLTLEAGTEMLIRGGYATPGRAWIEYDTDRQRHWVDFAKIADNTGVLSGGESRFLRIAASIADEGHVILGDVVVGLDHNQADLVLSAIAHTAGFDRPTSMVEVIVGESEQDVRFERVPLPILYPWGTPAADPAKTETPQ